jgi:LacI family transcriptional regulator
MGVTIRDVARRAGVSPATVSRVLNDTCAVDDEKRRLVLNASRDLGYTPNPAARSLLGKRTGGLGVLLPFVGAEFFSVLLTGLDEAAQELEAFLVVSTSHRHAPEFRSAMHAMQKRVDGVIVMAPELGARDAEVLATAGGPVVLVNTYVEQHHMDVINFDNYGGARAVTQHLLDLGHRRIALIKGPAVARDAQERARGYRDAMAEAGISQTDALEYDGDYSQEAGYAAASRIAQAAPRPTAIVAANDYCAMGALRALHEAGLAIPDDIAVAGFDGIVSAQYTQPPLTTVHVPTHQIGHKAVARLAELLRAERAGPPRHEVVPVELVVRASTAGSREASPSGIQGDVPVHYAASFR